MEFSNVGATRKKDAMMTKGAAGGFRLLNQVTENGAKITFTNREEDLQKLLIAERKRSEQRRINYNGLKAEHLKLQDEFLKLQAEMKQILEETMHFKEMKTNEIDEVCKMSEAKSKQIERLEKIIHENDPEVMRIRLADELEEPKRKLEKEKDRLIQEREKLFNELKLYRQQIDHMEKEHLDAIENVKLSYEIEVNTVKREKEEIRMRLVEASQVPDVKKLIELSEENAKLNRKLQSAHELIEQAEQRYRVIQQKIEDIVLEQEQKERANENRVTAMMDQIGEYKQEIKNLKNVINEKNAETEDLLKEIGRLRRIQEKLKFDLDQQRLASENEKEAIVIKLNSEIKNLNEEKLILREEIKKSTELLEQKDSQIASLERTIEMKEREFNERLIRQSAEELEKFTKLEHETKTLELKLESVRQDKRELEQEIEKLKRQIEQLNELKLSQERETLLLRAKLDSQTAAIEELEKIRRQHSALHDEMDRIRMETHELHATNRELTRVNQNMKEDIGRLKEQLEEERRHLEEVNLANEKILAKLTRRFEDDRTELLDRVKKLETENGRLKLLATTQTQKLNNPNQQVYSIKAEEYSRLKARQYAMLADRLNSLLEQLNIGENSTTNHSNLE